MSNTPSRNSRTLMEPLPVDQNGHLTRTTVFTRADIARNPALAAIDRELRQNTPTRNGIFNSNAVDRTNWPATYVLTTVIGRHTDGFRDRGTPARQFGERLASLSVTIEAPPGAQRRPGVTEHHTYTQNFDGPNRTRVVRGPQSIALDFIPIPQHSYQVHQGGRLVRGQVEGGHITEQRTPRTAPLEFDGRTIELGTLARAAETALRASGPITSISKLPEANRGLFSAPTATTGLTMSSGPDRRPVSP